MRFSPLWPRDLREFQANGPMLKLRLEILKITGKELWEMDQLDEALSNQLKTIRPPYM